MKTICFSLLVFLLVSCGNNSNGNSDQKLPDSLAGISTQKDSATHNLSGCYLRVIKRDTFALSIEEHNNEVSGRLSFDNYEKDGSTGAVTGKVNNDVLKLIYSFQSEGMHSVMEIYFKITSKGLVQGIGEVTTRSDTTYYANPMNVSYPAGNELMKISCEDLDAKFR